MYIVLSSVVFILVLVLVLNNPDTIYIYGSKSSKYTPSNSNLKYQTLLSNDNITTKTVEPDIHISIYGVVNSSFSLSSNNFWFATGNWFIDLANDTPVFDLNMTWYNNKEPKQRIYHISNFKSTYTKDEILQNNILLTKGIANISINNQIKSQIPITIQIQKNKIMTLYYNDKIFNLHFNGQPLHGLVTAITTRNELSSNNKPYFDNMTIQKTSDNQQQNLSNQNNILPNITNNNIINNKTIIPSSIYYKSIIIPEDAGLIGNPSYYPSIIKIKEGEELIVINKDKTSHTLTSINKGDGSVSQLGIFFDTDMLQPLTSKIIDTSKLNPGVYPFECTIHTFMKGTLIVE